MASDVRFVWHGETFARELGEAMEPALLAAARSMRGDVAKSMEKRGARGIPSEPGTPPHVQTNVLRGSIAAISESSHNKRQARAYVGTNVKYGRLHEHGGTVKVKEHTRSVLFGKKVDKPYTVPAHDATYPARPFLKPVMDDTKSQNKAHDVFVKVIIKRLMRAALPNA